MPAPLKSGFNIHVEHSCKPASTAMRSTDVYTDFYGISILISGDRETITPNGIYYSHAGDIGVMGTGIYHRTAPLSDIPYERYGIKFTHKMAERLINIIGEEPFQDFLSHIIYQINPDIQEKVIRIFKEMLYEYEHYTQTSELILEGMLNHLLVTVWNERIMSSTKEIELNITDDVIWNVLSYLDLHYAENPSIEELARIAHLSSSQFMKRFKTAVGSSYKMYMKCYKTRMAQSILLNTTKSINEISDSLGFCNANYFCNVFTEIYGCSPQKYRKENKKTS